MRPGFWFFLLLLLSSCSSKYLRYGNPEQLAKIEEFDRAVKIEAAPEAPEVVPTENLVSAPQAPAKKTLTRAKKIQRRKDSTVIEMAKRQPDIEDDEGFDGRRRPLVDPFRVGEKVKHEVHYFGATAGYLTFKIDPFVMVNDRKSYQFVIAVETAPFFSRFYRCLLYTS
ncbi:MAG: DUF3108 domain-containing protein, partial [Bdellovibrionaceae bacterium]|nr:DUF3108 domain-containing protein [Pseudobdellovibrionaceae bacterium]